MSHARASSSQKEKINNAYNFSQEQLRILNKNGITPYVAFCLLSESHEAFCSLRGNDSEKMPSILRLSRPSYPKPGSIKAKSCNIGPASSFVAMDANYSKAEQTVDGIKPYPRNSENDFPPFQPTMTAPVALQELLADLASGEYELVSAEEGALCFKLSKEKAKRAPDEINNNLYYVDLNPNKGYPPVELKSKAAIGLNANNLLDKPEWWNEAELGDYKQIAEYSFNLQYKNPAEKNFQDFLIAAKSFKGRNVPIIGDYDQFILGFSDSYKGNIFKIMPEANEPIYAMETNIEGVNRLVTKRLRLELLLFEKKVGCEFDPDNQQHREARREIRERLIRGKFVKGNITPLESVYSDEKNKQFKEEMPHLGNFFQHASEVRNPFKPSKIGTIVFFIEGEIHEVIGSKEVASLLLNKALPKFHFYIHHVWNMD
ncbi:MAG TPA: hypothetical protein VHA13_03150, partial [Gammaproteobacteria bacterium]|nr:hypothetical protein [Gammaproteobacteria bacterium]